MLASMISLALVTLGHSGLPDQSKLKDAFNAAKGKVRVVMLVSPKCGACVEGADVVRDGVHRKLRDKRLSTFSVFIPMVPGDGLEHAVESSKRMTAAGIPSYWDGERKLGRAYAGAVTLPKGQTVAWDVYFVYGPDAVWGPTPPKPSYWMHQLSDDERCLDPEKLLAAVRKELKALPSSSRR